MEIDMVGTAEVDMTAGVDMITEIVVDEVVDTGTTIDMEVKTGEGETDMVETMVINGVGVDIWATLTETDKGSKHTEEDETIDHMTIGVVVETTGDPTIKTGIKVVTTGTAIKETGGTKEVGVTKAAGEIKAHGATKEIGETRAIGEDSGITTTVSNSSKAIKDGAIITITTGTKEHGLVTIKGRGSSNNSSSHHGEIITTVVITTTSNPSRSKWGDCIDCGKTWGSYVYRNFVDC